VAFGRRMQPPNCFGRDVDSGGESKRHLSKPDVVVDRLRDAYYWESELVHLLRAREGSLATNGDERIDAIRLERRTTPVESIVGREWVDSRRPKDRASTGEQPSASFDVERHVPIGHHALPPVEESNDLVAIGGGLADDSANDGIETRGIAAAGEDCEFHAPDTTSHFEQGMSDHNYR
jgi:hypothetical protein